jgi:GNAT superfamily N-acetyltransferase
VTIETAGPDDVHELAGLRYALYDEYGDADVPFDVYEREFRPFAVETVRHPGWRVWVAREDGRLVGTMWLQLVTRVPQPVARHGRRPIGYLTNAYVAPGYRNAGLGSRMLEAVRTWAQAEGVGPIVCWPAPGEDATRFYTRAGFRREDSPMVLDVPGPPDPPSITAARPRRRRACDGGG